MDYETNEVPLGIWIAFTAAHISVQHMPDDEVELVLLDVEYLGAIFGLDDIDDFELLKI